MGLQWNETATGRFMACINKPALLRHVEEITKTKAKMSEPFSAGQFWCCFEFVMEDGGLVIARVRLPRHPDSDETVTEDSESYAIQCEVATMSFLQHNFLSVPSPKLYAYASPGSKQANAVGACHMLIEGFYGNTLQDVKFDICDLPVDTQENIITQWTAIQAELATFCFPKIGSISHLFGEGCCETTIGPLGAAVAERFRTPGPFNSSHEYFTAVGEARFIAARKQAQGSDEPDKFVALGSFIFCDIVSRTQLFKDENTLFQLNHMDMGTQNILVDDDYNFLAIIGWEFAQTAPVQVNHYPMPFPLLWSDVRIQGILKNPNHLAHRNIVRQCSARNIYKQKFLEAEQAFRDQGRVVHFSIANELDKPAARVYAALEKLDGFGAEALTYEMVRLAFGFEGEEARQYVAEMEEKLNN
jgi:hypothetical protein